MKITHPDIDWRGATPIAQAFGDIYYSPEDAVGEVRHNFVTHIEPMMGQQAVMLIGETGFGTGLNFLMTWHTWLKRRRPGDRLIFVSTEAHPLRTCDLRKALAPFADLRALADQLIKVWPVGIPGPHRRFFDVGGERAKLELWVLYGDALAELKRQNFQADAWYFDGFNPSDNPALWSPELITQCTRLMAPGAVGGTFTVASAVRQAMDTAGLKTQKRPGFGRKRECLRVEKPGKILTRPGLIEPSLKIRGRGIAGCSAYAASISRGYRANIFAPTIPKSTPVKSASINPAALVNFKPTKAPGEPGNRFLAASLAHVQCIYENLWLPGRGTFKPALSDSQAEDWQKCIEIMGWSEACLEYRQDPDQGLISPVAGYVAPQQVLSYLQEGALPDGNDGEYVGGSHEIWAMGYGSIDGAPSIEPALRRNLGQVDTFAASDCPDLPMPITYGGYLSPRFGHTVLAGSTYERDPNWGDPDLFKPKQSATNEIVDKAFAAGFSLPFNAQESHVSARAFGKDHRPIVGQTHEGAWVLTGLGSRGFLTAPLLAEILLDEMEGRDGASLPTYDFKSCVHPMRFRDCRV